MTQSSTWTSSGKQANKFQENHFFVVLNANIALKKSYNNNNLF